MSNLRQAAQQTLEQPEQQPVAWTTMPESEDWCFVSGGKDPTGKLEGKWFPLYTAQPPRKPLTEIELDAEFNRGYKEGARDAYARAPQRKPLTDAEIAAIVRVAAKGSAIKRDGSTSQRIARAIEAAHGIKEGT